jgi:protein gp37
MAKNSSIEWTDHTFNPWWGCAKVSPGCNNCYAETWAKRLGLKVWGQQQDRRFFTDKHWQEPMKWNADAKGEQHRKRVFCASMADVFEAREELAIWRERLWGSDFADTLARLATADEAAAEHRVDGSVD